MRRFLAGRAAIWQKTCGRRSPGAGGDEGFSLLEVLVATIIMGLVMVVVLQVLTATLRAQEASQNHLRAVMVAEKVLQEYCDLQKSKGGTYQGQEGRYSYLVRLTPQFDVAPTLPGQSFRATCLLIEVRVFWVERGREKSLELRTMRSVGQKRV